MSKPLSGGSPKPKVELRLRAANLDDARFLFRLRNDPVTRKNSFRSGELRFSDHVAWLRDRLGDRSRRVRLWIALWSRPGRAPVPIGQVRYDCDARRARAEISITLAAPFRGRGLATPLLVAAIGRAPSAIERVLARVRPENEASLRAFVRAGFRRHGGVRVHPAPHLVLLWRRPVSLGRTSSRRS